MQPPNIIVSLYMYIFLKSITGDMQSQSTTPSKWYTTIISLLVRVPSLSISVQPLCTLLAAHDALITQPKRQTMLTDGNGVFTRGSILYKYHLHRLHDTLSGRWFCVCGVDDFDFGMRLHKHRQRLHHSHWFAIKRQC